MLKRIEMLDGAAYIEKQCFDDARIEEVILPSTLREIDNKCLKGVIRSKPFWLKTTARSTSRSTWAMSGCTPQVGSIFRFCQNYMVEMGCSTF